MRVPELNEEKSWMAAHIYYSEPWENLLIKGLFPLIMSEDFRKSMDQFFFIRFWERGPHIRLRVKGEEKVLEDTLKPLVSAHFNSYFTSYSSKRNGFNEQDISGWYDNNSIQYLSYDPEIVRYGGASLLPLAEKQFQASSFAVLSLLRDNSEEWDYSSALGAGIQLHLSFAFAAGMNEREVLLFFNQVFQNWFPRAYQVYAENITKRELNERKHHTLKVFKSNLDAQKEVLIPHVKTVWQALRRGEGFENDILNDWIISNQKITKEMTNEVNSDRFSFPSLFKVYKTLETSEQNQRLWSVYDSLIHMTNNRLGIRNHDEGYLAYLMYESFKA
ncbi:lantibiotic dehydratase C-terminal domain-containing protein [Fulvivirga sediminis]|uniref:Thiopeptide-type bacteriocin biosynthesis domain-containing protein n=1 Tax=Fulvivirga sediminis TaxID=2803949 RepID=A0A937JZU8_9BACT|nr:lantibiotic dehydratase C-terminal domain-containing protein [Fulvivirga sediminis]MBL3657009.1 hypothetical protein [Fulvivirga sediminis]